MVRLLSILTIALISMSACTSHAGAKGGSPNNKYASLVMDADTGTIVSQRYGDKRLHPASLTKMMTLLMVFEALDRGDLKKTDRAYVSKYAASMVPSKFYLKPGQYITIENGIYALVTKSANDVAVALAEKVGGTESQFANLMTRKARAIGMRNTTFKNASGLHNKAQVSTAHDMATLARYILQRYPHYYRYFSTKNFNYNGKSYRNHNRLMDSYKGMDGFKTGYIGAAGFNLVASARQNNRRLIGVVFGGRSSKSRNDHMREILDQGFKKARNIRTARIITPPVPKSKPPIRLASAAKPAVASVPTMPSLSQPPQVKAMGVKPEQPAIEKSAIAAKRPVSQQEASAPYASVSAMSSDRNFNRPVPESTLTRAIETGQFGLVGQGDIDLEQSNRATNVARTQQDLSRPSERVIIDQTNVPATIPTEWDAARERIAVSPVDLPHPKSMVGKWSIQIGAFTSRVKSDDALRNALKTLPPELSQITNPISVPMNTTEGSLFRARLGGLSEKQAFEACTYFKDCMKVAPNSVRISTQ